VLGVSIEQVTADVSLKELGADSLDLVELVMELEEDFDFSIPDEDAESIRTIGDFVRYFERRMRRAGPSGDA
jgi:acyl carrier protein